MLYSYAAWDTMFNNIANYRKTFTDEQMDSFVEEYFNTNILQSTNVDFVIIYSANGSVIRTRAMDYNTGNSNTDINLIPKLFRELPKFIINNGKNPFYKNGGFIVNDLNNQIVLYNIGPVTPTRVTQDTIPTGLFLEARYFGTTLLSDISKTVQSCISTHLWNDNNDAISKKFRSSLTNYKSNMVVPQLDKDIDWFNVDVFATGILSQEQLDHRVCWSPNDQENVTSNNRFASYELVGDINGDPLFISRVDQSRNIQTVGVQTLLLAIFLLFGVCILATVVIIVFIERRILYRVSSLTKRIQQITGTNDSKQRINLFRKDDDEIGFMVRNINGLLTSLDNLLEESKEQEIVKKLFQRIAIVEETTKNIMNAIKDIVLTIGEGGNIIYANHSFYEQLGYNARNINGSVNNSQSLTIDVVFPYILNTLKTAGSTSSLSTTTTTITNQHHHIPSIDNMSIVNSRENLITNENNNKNNNNEISVGNIYTIILRELEDGRSHIIKAATKNHKETIDFECIITKTYVIINNVETVAYVLVGRKLSNRFSSSSMTNTLSEEDEEILGEFDKMLLDEHERLKFKEFCRNEKSEENILFIESVLEYKNLKQPHERMIKQEYILNTFLSNENHLNLSDEIFTKELPIIKRGIGQVDLFDNLLIYVETTVCKDTFMRFKQQQTHLMYL
ncbi:hypothetical protein ABK040_010902 [Willaertia magna]